MYQKKKGGGKSNYQRQFGGGGGNRGDNSNNYDSSDRTKNDSAAEYRRQKIETAKQVETDFGIERFVLLDNQQSAERRGWLYNLVPTTVSGHKCTSFCAAGWVGIIISLHFCIDICYYISAR